MEVGIEVQCAARAFDEERGGVRQPASPEWCPTCHRAPSRCNTHSCKRPTFRVNKNYQYNVRHNSNRNPCVEEFDGSIILRGPHGVNKQKKDVEFHMYIS